MSQFEGRTENIDVRDTNQSRHNEQERTYTYFDRTAQNDVVGHLLHAQKLNESSETSSKQFASFARYTTHSLQGCGNLWK